MSTGTEILALTEGKSSHFIATMGTGGTITGCAQSLNTLSEEEGKKPPQIIGVDPIGSILKEYFETGKMGVPHTYKVEGFGEDFIPPATDFTHIDEIRQVNDEQCFIMARRLARKEGLFSGGSAGGAIQMDLEVA